MDKYKNKGLSGLSNLGNTCFINSCMQILSHTYELNEFLENGSYKQKLKNKCDSLLMLEWDNLRQMLWNENCVVSPNKFIKTIQKISTLKKIDTFSNYSQNDVSEFLLFIIDCFHTSISREIKITITGKPENETDLLAVKCFEMIKQCYTKDYSEIWNLFYAVQISVISRIDNNQILSTSPEPYFIINLPIPSNHKCPSLIDCFNHYVEGETIEQYKYEPSNEVLSIHKKISFWSFPTILTIDLKRFNHRFQKNQSLVTFPLDDLDLSPYVIGYKKEQYKYELYGVCNHSGGVMGGHYTCFIKNANGKWYHCNDTIIAEANIDSIVSPKAYVLFYRKKSMST